MKFFPLKSTLLCLIAIPVLYTLTLKNVQSGLSRHYLNKIQNIMIANAEPLLQGSETLEERLTANIDHFLAVDGFYQMARPELSVFVTTGKGQILYPTFEKEKQPRKAPKDVARRNFALLSQGITPTVDVDIPYGSLFANAILSIFLLVSLGIFSPFYYKASRLAKEAADANDSMIEALKEEDRASRSRLADLKQEKQKLSSQMDEIKGQHQKDQNRAKANETEMFDEIVKLEAELETVREQELEKEAEIEDLKSRIQRLEKRKSPKAKRSPEEMIQRRFSALYKGVDFHAKALAGFAALTDDMQIKAEEVILQLDREPEKVIVKRKVFSGKKHKSSALEVIFGYNGRFYFRHLDGGRAEVLVIGNKNTQHKDMEFLHKL